MSDIRQKLLPVFLEEAKRKILQLDDFLTAVGGEGRSLDDLETAFRAAHTLKGTAALVQAEAVRSLSGRMEALLEVHYERGCFPSDVEYEAMQLALERLEQLVAAVEKGTCAPPDIAAEAELALKLAAAMPGRKRLAELFDKGNTDDPFAEDPALESLQDYSPTQPVVSPLDDPFAEDPPFDAKPVFAKSTVDLFADDPVLEPDPEAAVIGAVADSEVVDPFADDPALESSAESVTEAVLVDELASSTEVAEPVTEESELVPEDVVNPEPVAVQAESYADRMRKRLAKESALGTAERLAATLLSQGDGEIVERKYTCCRFRVAEKDYYLPISNMVEIADLPGIIRLPLAPPIVRGLVNLRGRVLPLIDLAVQAGSASRYVAVHKLVVADAGSEQLAFLTDGIPDLSEEITGEKVDVRSLLEQFRAGGD